MRIETDFSGLGTAVVLDFETTGVNAATDRVVSFCAIRADFGCVRLNNGQLNLPTVSMQEVVNPTIRIPQSASRVHGIYDKDVVGKRTFAEAAQELRDFIGDSALISHNMRFDGEFLDAEFARSRINPMKFNRRFCTMLAVHKRAKIVKGDGAKWPRLAESGQYVGVSSNQSETHTAVEDAIIALKLVVGLMTTYVDPATRKVFRFS